jgi:hypothetical protein
MSRFSSLRSSDKPFCKGVLRQICVRTFSPHVDLLNVYVFVPVWTKRAFPAESVELTFSARKRLAQCLEDATDH